MAIPTLIFFGQIQNGKSYQANNSTKNNIIKHTDLLSLSIDDLLSINRLILLSSGVDD